MLGYNAGPYLDDIALRELEGALKGLDGLGQGKGPSFVVISGCSSNVVTPTVSEQLFRIFQSANEDVLLVGYNTLVSTSAMRDTTYTFLDELLRGKVLGFALKKANEVLVAKYTSDTLQEGVDRSSNRGDIDAVDESGRIKLKVKLVLYGKDELVKRDALSRTIMELVPPKREGEGSE